MCMRYLSRGRYLSWKIPLAIPLSQPLSRAANFEKKKKRNMCV